MDRRGEILLGIFGVVAGVVIGIGFAHRRATYFRHEEIRSAERELAAETYLEFWRDLEPHVIPHFLGLGDDELDRTAQASIRRIAHAHGMTGDELRALWDRVFFQRPTYYSMR